MVQISILWEWVQIKNPLSKVGVSEVMDNGADLS